jgi:anti-anti-sigma factor
MIEVLGSERDGAPSGLRLVEHGDHSLVTAFGEIDLAVRQVAQDLCHAVAERGLPLVIDAADVTFVDSAGMSVLVRLARDAEVNGYPVALRRAPWILQELLTVTGLDRLLPLAEGEPTPERPTAPQT